MEAGAFISYWCDKDGSERANYQKFLTELCRVIGAPEPEASHQDDDRNDYVFERRVKALDIDGEDIRNNYIDLYKKHCFVLEAKQSRKRWAPEESAPAPDLFGAPAPARPPQAWDRLMKQARAQAERYAKALPKDHGWPPFLVVVDVGNVIETYADFTGLGKAYLPFPDSRSHRVRLDELMDPEIRARLRAVWMAPRSLDPSTRRAEATKDIAVRLARMARTLERRHEPKAVALFLMRCLFTAFAQSVGLLPEDAFLKLLRQAEPNPDRLPAYLNPFWENMDRGSPFDIHINAPIRRFNGHLFREAEALPLDRDEMAELINACGRDWRNVEPAIFGTLLENALEPRERDRLGAHFTPRAYVERLVVPTLLEPLMEDWRAAQALAEVARAEGNTQAAMTHIREFHHRLCTVRVMDPACGTGNFLYVALELMKKLEGDVLLALEELGAGRQERLDLQGISVGPQQFIGLEKNQRAVAIAELVLWLGHLQGHLRLRGPESLSEPILRAIDTIREMDAVLTWRGTEPVLDAAGRPRRRWDGVSRRTDPLTGEQVPDPEMTVPMERYLDPAPAVWPEADFIIGNPPFVAGKDLRQELGDGYAEALWRAYPHMPGGADFVMYWWDKSAELARAGRIRRFGFITTNSITQTFSRRVMQRHLKERHPLHMTFAIPDHPWADTSGAAMVRVAMTVGAQGPGPGILKTVRNEGGPRDADGAVMLDFFMTEGVIQADLSIGADVAGSLPLRANRRLSCPGVKLHGKGFLVTPAQARGLGLGTLHGLENHIRQYRNGRDLTGRPRGKMVIDLYGLSDAQTRQYYPAVYQWLLDRVKPERAAKAETADGRAYFENWWLHGKTRPELRRALSGLTRYIATVETAKHRIFQFLDASILPDNMLVAIALDDGFSLGVLSSRIHQVWAIAAGGWLGFGNDPRYQKSNCFDPFPFPEVSVERRRAVGERAEELDKHRKQVMDANAGRFTLTELYNVMERRRALRDGVPDTPPLSATEEAIDLLGQCGVLLDLHDRLDRTVAAAYGWPADMRDAEILERVVALNRERAAEEARGEVRWLRPDYQNPAGAAEAAQLVADLDEGLAASKRPAWPKVPVEQIRVLAASLRGSGAMPATSIARRFHNARADRVKQMLDVLVSMGQARRIGNDRYAS
ncbi:MAG TPA: DNA methyltransferase [Azospirillaceae bacterium]|nr:DNA methyltransferase [Azospirillaceae bacterium]